MRSLADSLAPFLPRCLSAEATARIHIHPVFFVSSGRALMKLPTAFSFGECARGRRVPMSAGRRGLLDIDLPEMKAYFGISD